MVQVYLLALVIRGLDPGNINLYGRSRCVP